MYWLSFYVENRYPTIKPRKWWQFWVEPEIEMQECWERMSFCLTEEEAQFFIKDSKEFASLFKRFFPTATRLQLEHGNLSKPYVKTGALCRNNSSHAHSAANSSATWKST